MNQLFRQRSRARQLSNRKSFLQGTPAFPSQVRKNSPRALRCEQLEDRALMAADFFVSDFWNYQHPQDVNADAAVSPIDALVIINELNTRGPRQLSGNSFAAGSEGEGESAASKMYYDVDNDGFVSPLDALMVINSLNAEGEDTPIVKYTIIPVAVGTNTPITTITKGSDYELRVLIQDVRPGSHLGVFAGYLDINFDQAKTNVSVSEIQRIAINGSPTGGTFQLTFNGQTTAPINFAFDSGTQIGDGAVIATNISNALAALGTPGPGDTITAADIEVTPDPNLPNAWQIRFVGKLADFNQAPLSGNLAGLTGGSGYSLTVDEVVAGDPNSPAAFLEAFRPRVIPGVVPQVFFKDSLNATSVFGKINDAGALSTTTTGTLPRELFRVRMNANDGGVVNFSPDVSYDPDPLNPPEDGVVIPAGYTLIYQDDVQDTTKSVVPPTQIITIGGSITITEPVSATADTLTVSEDSNFTTLSPLGNDTLTTGGTLRITAIGVGSNGGTINPVGVLGAVGTTQLQYRPAANFFGTETFTYTIGDGLGNFDSATVTVQVTGVNDAPVVTVVSPKSVNEDTPLVFANSDIQIADAEVGGGNIQTTVSLTPGTGTLTLGTLSGITINGGANGSSTITFTGTLANVDAALNGMRYDPAFNFAGATTLTLTAFDGSLSSPVTPIAITVNPVNDVPVNAFGFTGTQTATEGEDLVFSSALGRLISISDVDAASGLVQVTLSSVQSKANITVDSAGLSNVTGNGTTSVTLTGTVATLNTALNGVIYRSIGLNIGADTLRVVTNDQGNTGSGGNQIDTDDIIINIEPSIRPRVIPDNFTAIEGLTPVVLDVMGVSGNSSGKDLASLPDPTVYATRLISFDANAVIPGTSTIVGTLTRQDNALVGDDTDDTLLFTPTNADYFGPIEFSYTITDTKFNNETGTGEGSSTGKVTINVTNVNDAPSGADATVTTLEDIAYTFAAANFGFTDPVDAGAGHTLAAVKITTLPATGTLTNNGANVTAGQFVSVADIASGKLKYTPASNANGSGAASFTFQVQDSGGTLNTGIDLDPTANTITVDVTAVNDAPSFTKGANQTVLEDAGLQTVNGWATAILAGPSDEVGQTVGFQITSVSNPSLFSVQPTVDAGGNLSYQSAVNANGTATITIVAQDSGGTANNGLNTSAAQTFTITISAVNDNPVAQDDGPFTLGEDGFFLFDPRANDTDIETPQPLTLPINVLTGPAHGTVTAEPSGGFRYTPNPDYNGTDSFTYQIQDGSVVSNTATVSFNVTAFNDPPVANNDPNIAVVEDVPLTFDVRGNDTDPEGAGLSIGSFTQPMSGGQQRGTITLSNNQFTYTPALNDNSVVDSRPITFTYFVNDGEKNSVLPATVTISVSPVNDAPVANHDGTPVKFTMIKNFVDQAISGVLTNDTDVDTPAGNLFISRLQGTAAVPGSGTTFATPHGTVKLGPGNTVLYTPNADYEGLDEFTYTVSDGALESTATIFVEVVNFIPTNISGHVYKDEVLGAANVYDAGIDRGLVNVEIRLTGTDFQGNAVNVSVRTDADGRYIFPAVRPNMPGQPYVLQEIQPLYFKDGGEHSLTGGVPNSFATRPLNGQNQPINDQFHITLPILGVPGGANNTNFFEGTFDTAALPDSRGFAAEMFVSSSGNGLMLSTGLSSNWYFALNGWGNLDACTLTMDSDLSAATLTFTDALGSHTKRIFRDPNDVRNTNRPLVDYPNDSVGAVPSRAAFRILGLDNNGGYILRIDGTAADFGITLASAGGGEGEGMSEASYVQGADAVFTEAAWA